MWMHICNNLYILLYLVHICTIVCIRRNIHTYRMLKEQQWVFEVNTHDQGGTYEYNRDRKSLKKFKDYYRTQKPDHRNYALVVLGLNTALRISDILNLTYDMVYHKGEVRTHIVVKERKTGKSNQIIFFWIRRYERLWNPIILIWSALHPIVWVIYIFFPVHVIKTGICPAIRLTVLFKRLRRLFP